MIDSMHLSATTRVFEVEQPQGGPTMSKRELIDTGTDKRDVRRDKDGKFKESDDVSRSLCAMRATTRNKKPNQAGR